MRDDSSQKKSQEIFSKDLNLDSGKCPLSSLIIDEEIDMADDANTIKFFFDNHLQN